jgi:lysophospholipase L1-like esterase
MDWRPSRLTSKHIDSCIRRRWNRSFAFLVFGVALGASGTRAAGQSTAGRTSADFAFRDGDTVVFLGDSNTRWGSYVKDIENYALFHFPERRIRFINAGLDGDMMSKAFFRLERDVFSRGATVVVVLFGLNDISWGRYADSTIRHVFLEYTAKIVDSARARHVRSYVLSYPLTAAPIGPRAGDPSVLMAGTITATDTSLLQRFGDDAMKIARAHGAQTIDVQREMRQVMADLPAGTRIHQDDGGHLNNLGSQILAFAILRGLGAPASVSSVEIDAANLRIVKAERATISELKRTGGRIEFTRLDKGLPLTFPQGEPRPQFHAERVFAVINGYFLKLTGLAPGARFELRAGAISLAPKCGFPSEGLGRGVDLAALGSTYYVPRGPWAQQAIALGIITDAKSQLESSIFYQDENELDSPSWKQMRSRVNAALDDASAAQKAIAKPVAYRFELEQLTPAVIAECSKRPPTN